MKTTLNAEELRSLNACCVANGGKGDGLDRFIAAHGERTVTLTQAFSSNGWNDIWWYIDAAYEQFDDEQKKDLRLLAADYVERVLPIFEKERPDDNRLRKVIQAARDYAYSLIDDGAKATARKDAEAARAAVGVRATKAALAVGATKAAKNVRAARIALTTRSAVTTVTVWIAEAKWQEEKLLELFAKWESENEIHN